MVAPAALVGRLRNGKADLGPLALAVLQGALSLAALWAAAVGLIPAAAAALWLGVGLWWNAQTISHIHLHTPLFKARRWNRAFALYLTVLTGLPQSLWRARHLWHHGGERRDRPWRLPRAEVAVEAGLILSSWAAMAVLAPRLVASALAPGYALGLGLCWLHGHFEHAGVTPAADPGVSVYHGLYNRLWFNDGYHAEHHGAPGLHWSRLPARRLPDGRASRWPPVLRWLDALGPGLNRRACAALDALERLALRLGWLRRYALARHERALARLLPELSATGAPPVRVAIVGGGLFPRTALALRRLLPAGSEIVVIERSAAHIRLARACLAAEGAEAGDVAFVMDGFRADLARGFGLVVIPLGYRGDREALYRRPPAPLVVVHDWLWRRRGQASVPVSVLLLKRLNLLRAEPGA